jgi:uncharacterized repeat protein (TIGR01451 family)
MVRRLIAAGIALVVLIVIVVVVSGCVKSAHTEALKNYNRDVSRIATESDEQVSAPLFSTLTDAAGKSAVSVQVQVNQYLMEAQALATSAKNLNAPGAMASAQRDLTLVMNLRAEGLTKIAALLPTALGGQGTQASTLIAGAMEIFLASDVVYSQRVAPLIQQTLSSNGVHGLSTASTHFLPNIGWLEPTVVQARITGQQANGQNSTLSAGTHGSALLGTSVGTNALSPEPTLNHISGGGSPTFTVNVENAGTAPETNVKVDVTVSAGGKQLKASHVVNSAEPGTKFNVEIPVSGIPLGVASKIEVYVEPVPGETNAENNKNTYLAIFGT